MKKILYLLSVGMLFFTGCSEDDGSGGNDGPTKTSLEIIAENPSYSVFTDALELTGLNAKISGTANFTVFAPSNSDLASVNINKVSDRTAEQWEEIINYHIVSGKIEQSQLPASGSIASEFLANDNVKVDIYVLAEEGVAYLNDGIIIAGSKESKNGIVHFIGGVLLPVDIYDYLSFVDLTDNDMNTLIDRANYADKYKLNTNIYTLFAYTEEALDLYQEAQSKLIRQLQPSVAQQLVNNIEIKGKRVQSSGLNGNIATSGKSMTIDQTTVNGTIKLVDTDFNCSNGVVHFIDRVIE